MGKGEGVKLAQGMDYTLAVQCDLAIDEEDVTNIRQCILLCENMTVVSSCMLYGPVLLDVDSTTCN
jgi:hypothetical protein